MSVKPVKPKPHFYAVCLFGLMEIAKEHGCKYINDDYNN